jgi:hypothetical protein
MTSPKADNETLMAFPSSRVSPCAFVFDNRSLPPRSTSQSLLVVANLWLSNTYVHVIVIRNKQCDLLEVSLALVHEVDLLWLPLWYNLLASLASMMGISVKLSTSIYPFEAIWIERLHDKSHRCYQICKLHLIKLSSTISPISDP